MARRAANRPHAGGRRARVCDRMVRSRSAGRSSAGRDCGHRGGLLGFPTGPTVAVASAAVLHYARIDQHAGDPVTGPFFLLVAGVAVSVLFYGTPGSLKPAGGSVEEPDPRRALAPGRASPEDLEPSAYFRGLAALTAGVRELSHGDFTKHVDASDPGLRELAIALNEMLFTMRDFLTDLRRSAGQLSVAGAEITAARIGRGCDGRPSRSRHRSYCGRVARAPKRNRGRVVAGCRAGARPRSRLAARHRRTESRRTHREFRGARAWRQRRAVARDPSSRVERYIGQYDFGGDR